MRSFLTLILALGIALATQAQVFNIPDKAKKHFEDNYKSATNVDWSNNATNYRCKFKESGHDFTVHYNIDGDWSYTEKWIKEDEMPAKVKETFGNSKYRDWKKTNFVYVENADDQKYYRYDLKKGIKKMYLFIDKDGKVIKENASI